MMKIQIYLSGRDSIHNKLRKKYPHLILFFLQFNKNQLFTDKGIFNPVCYYPIKWTRPDDCDLKWNEQNEI